MVVVAARPLVWSSTALNIRYRDCAICCWAGWLGRLRRFTRRFANRCWPPQRSFRCAGIRASVALFTGDHQHLSWRDMLIDQYAVYLGDTHTDLGRGHAGPERLSSAGKRPTAAHKAKARSQ
jgi:hypothetical protein